MDLCILPIRDDVYRQTDLWIRSESEIKQKITRYNDLNIYLDLDYGNGRFFVTSKAATPKLRARLRVAHPLNLNRETLKARIHDCWRQQCNGGGCFESPLQYGDTTKIGALCLYPVGINIKAMERELMRRFGFKYPIALRSDWINQPYDGPNSKSEGALQLHVHTRSSDCKTIDLEFGIWLQPDTPNSELPWATQVHYVRDWKAAKDNLLTVPAEFRLKNSIRAMVTKVRVHEASTAVVVPRDTIIEGMLRPIQTRMYGELTLLRLLRSIKATPNQATAADEAKLAVDEEGYERVDRSSKRLGPSLPVPALDAPLGTTTLHTPNSSLSPSDRAIERLRQQQRDDHSASPLFYAIFPSEGGAGSYLFVVPHKFATLANNVLNGLVPFLRHHLDLDSSRQADKILARWVSSANVAHARRRNLLWNTAQLQATPGERDSKSTKSYSDFLAELDDLGFDDPTDVFDGTLTIDLEMAEAKCIDDGATVAGALNDQLETKLQLEEAHAELEEKDAEIEEKDAQLELQLNKNASLENKTASLQDENALLLAQMAQLQAIVDAATTADNQEVAKPMAAAAKMDDDGDAGTEESGARGDEEGEDLDATALAHAPAGRKASVRALQDQEFPLVQDSLAKTSNAPPARTSPSVPEPKAVARNLSNPRHSEDDGVAFNNDEQWDTVVETRASPARQTSVPGSTVKTRAGRRGSARRSVTPVKRPRPHPANVAEQSHARQYKPGAKVHFKKNRSSRVPQSPQDSAGAP